MKIAYLVLKGLPTGGGIETFSAEVGSRLVKKGHDVTAYVMPHYGTGPGSYKGIRVRIVPTIQYRVFEKMSAALSATVLSLVESDFDIVHFHAFGPAVFGLIHRAWCRPIVVQGHSLEWKRKRWNSFGRYALEILERPSVRLASQLTVVSEVQRKYIKQRYCTNSIVIPTGINRPRLRDVALIDKLFGLAGNDYLLFVGRLVPDKGIHILLMAFQQVETEMKLVIAGEAIHEDDYLQELKALAGNDRRIIFVGEARRELLWELYSNCFSFVLPSEVEGLSTVLLEAMSYKKICICSDIEENLEAIHGYGLTFNNGDSVDLAATIRLLLKQPENYRCLGEKAHKHVLKNHLWDDIANQVERMYRRILENGKG
jgi:glycosyltransferase involved in cell wall biosynthesis